MSQALVCIAPELLTWEEAWRAKVTWTSVNPLVEQPIALRLSCVILWPLDLSDSKNSFRDAIKSLLLTFSSGEAFLQNQRQALSINHGKCSRQRHEIKFHPEWLNMPVTSSLSHLTESSSASRCPIFRFTPLPRCISIGRLQLLPTSICRIADQFECVSVKCACVRVNAACRSLHMCVSRLLTHLRNVSHLITCKYNVDHLDGRRMRRRRQTVKGDHNVSAFSMPPIQQSWSDRFQY